MAVYQKLWPNGDTLTLETSAGGISVTSDENLTGSDREMVIELQTTNQGGKATDSFTVKQLKYSIPQDGYWVHKDTGVKTYFGLDDPSIEDGIMYSPSWKLDCSEVQLPSGVTDLSDYCFYGCSSIISITIPEGVISLGSNCFRNCSSLILATVLPATPPTLGTNVFRNVHTSFNIKVRSPYVNAYKTATNWNQYASIISAI